MLQLVAGLTAPEVATVLGMTVGQVKAMRHRGQINLARVLGLQSLEQPQESPSSRGPITWGIKRNINGEDVPRSRRTPWPTNVETQQRGEPGGHCSP
jgi:hypothetical protein